MEEEKKADHINIKVTSQDDSEIFFKIRKSTPLKKLMEAYCEKMSKQFSAVRFLFDGTRIQSQQTPNDLGMENDDTIEAMLEQTGGL